MTIYPEDFVIEIDHLLGNGAQQFWHSLHSEPSVPGLRINSLKVKSSQMNQLFPGALKPVSWAENGYQIININQYGSHPFHLAGLFYLQEPSAMAPVGILDPKPGEWILDLCAAPGGKTTQIQSAMKNQGVLVANDPNPRRVQALTRNIDRWGSRNTVVTCESPQRLAAHFGPVFDRVLVDAPCSGEGTFRSTPSEVNKWSSRFRDRCASLQDEILWYAGKLVRPGGTLVYSTCTFNQMENEGSIKRFLDKDPDFSLDPIPPSPGFSNGIPDSPADPHNLEFTMRIWPHLTGGEGHFVARLIKSIDTPEEEKPSPHDIPIFDAEKKKLYQDFFAATLHQTPETTSLLPEIDSLVSYGNQLFFVPVHFPSLVGLAVHRWGWHIGSYKPKRFLPSHALASSLTKKDVQMVLEFHIDDPDLDNYLRGSPVAIPAYDQPDPIWALVTIQGFSLGWGRIIQGRLKSFFPNWLLRT